ncbi:MAG TPA: hypothetical protein VHC92_03250 [Rhodanobacteraceae bacterium]|jgi:predicted ATP-grasp superfamily ATP-dependent carboligase|nr:hypothetical protein [Rhodanobacteraceae bacterium]
MVVSESRQVPVIVLGRGPTALGIVRCLQMSGIDCYVACKPRDQVTRSRWYRPTPGTPWDGTLGAAGLDALRAMPLGEAVVIPGADDAALWLADLPGSDLGKRFKVSTSSRQTLEILQDKVRFADFLRGTSIPHPRTFYVESAGDLATIPFEELDRVFIKPANSQKFSDVTGAKGVWASNRTELQRAFDDLHGKGFKLMVQEYVPGPASEHYFVDGFRDRNGEVTGLFARRRLRMHPSDFGNSSYCISIPLADVPAPIESMKALLTALDYRGVFSAEFKRDPRDGSFRILEVNTRAWTYVEFAGRCSVNVCEMAYRDALEERVPHATTDYRTGEGCINLYRDISAVFSKGSGTSLTKVLPQWMTGYFHTFRFDDPGPGWFAVRRIVTGYFRRRFGQSAAPIQA